MDSTVTLEQAKSLAALLPALMRQLMAGVEDPAADLPLAQLRVCSILCSGSRSMSALSRELAVSLSAMTQIADRLERAKLVRRVSKGTDRRIRCLELAERGEKIMRSHEDVRVKRVQAVLEHLDPTARDEALSTFESLIAACEATRDSDGYSKKHSFQFTAPKALL